jgi:hypothetical protein
MSNRELPTSAEAGCVIFAEAFHEELEYIRARRRHSQAGGEDAARTLIGLALSGGGIRSATTNLGVLQALSRMGILPLVDYISTVSGGGYIGACLSSLLSPARPGRDAPAEAAQPERSPAFTTAWESFPFNPGHPDGQSQIDHLRTHGTFLITRMGLFARETMRSIGHLSSGVLYHLAIVLLLLATLALAYMALVLTVAPEVDGLLRSPAAAAAGGENPAPETSHRADPTFSQTVAQKAAAVRTAVRAAAATPHGRAAALGAAIYGVLLSLAAFWYLLQARRRTTASPLPGESAEEAVERRLLRRVGYTALALTLGLFLVTSAVQPAHDRVFLLLLPALALLLAWATSFAIHLLLPWRPRWWTRDVRSLWGAFQTMTSYGFWGALLLGLFPLLVYALADRWIELGLSGVTALVIARVLTFRRAPAIGGWRIPAGLLRFLLGAAIALGLVFVLLAICASIVVAGGPTAAVLWVLAGLGLASFLVLGWAVDANRVSPHYFYRDRLAETYLFTEGKDRQGKTLHTMRDHIEMRLEDLHGEIPKEGDPSPAGTAPYHLISAAVNLAGSRDLTRKDRKSGYFLFSKLFCGSEQTDYRATRAYRGGETKLARALTISGAAVSSGIGSGTFFAQAFATVLFNLRLGFWMPNPRYRSSETAGERRRFWPHWLWREIFMRTDEGAALVNLSDGGHTGDNVGIYPLLKRRCRVIIACDAEHDPDLSFGSITEALRHAYIDLGIDVDIDFTMVRPDPQTGLSRSHCAVGLIRYAPDAAGERLVGYLIYLKSSLSGDEPEPILNYKSAHPVFPHESTADQFFDDAQFESYRALGVHIAEQTFGAWIAEPEAVAFQRDAWPLPPAGAGRPPMAVVAAGLAIEDQLEAT